MYKHAAALTVRREDVSLIPRPALFVGWWKSEGPGISCMRMRFIKHEIISCNDE